MVTFVNANAAESTRWLREATADRARLRRKPSLSKADRYEDHRLAMDIHDYTLHLANLRAGRAEGNKTMLPSLGEETGGRPYDIRTFERALASQRAASRARRARPVPASAASSHDYDRDVVREPDSVEDGKFKDPWDLRGIRVYSREPGKMHAELRSRALAAIEKMPACSDVIRSKATEIVERFDGRDSKLERHILLTSRPAYVRAWAKCMNNKQVALTPDERQALSAVQQERALTTTDIQSGYLIPWQLDSVLIIASTFVRSDLRQAAHVVTATSDVWNGVSSQNIAFSYAAEGSEVSDSAPPFGQPSIPVYTGRGFVPVSIEMLGDAAANATQEIARLLANGRQDLESNKFIVGAGVSEPTGLLTALGISGNSGSVVTSASAGVFALSDVHSLVGALPPHYRPQASFLGNNLIYSKIREFDTAGGGSLWASNLTEDRPPQLLNRPAREAEVVPSVIASGNRVLIYGDLAQFTIVDHIGGQVTELVPHLFSTSHNRPSGSRGWLSTFRSGSDLVNSVGVRCLSIQ